MNCLEYRVTQILEGGYAVVCTRGLRRVVCPSTKEVVAELLTPELARVTAETFNELRPNGPEAVVVKYSVGYRPPRKQREKARSRR